MRQFAIACVVLVAASAQAADWPQWLGKNRDGATEEKVEPWKAPLREVWKVKVGEGHSGPIVAGGRVFLHSRKPKADVEELTAYSADKGEVLWTKSYERGKFASIFGSGPRATPAFDGDKVYAHGVTGILTCFDAAKGDVLWQVNTLKEFKAANLFFGMSCSPVIDKDRLFLNVGGKGASVVALDKNNGKVVWKTLDDTASYASPIVYGEGDERQAVFLTNEGIIGVAVRDGSLFWRHEFPDKIAESSTTPVKAGDILIGSTITRGTAALRLDHTGAIPRAKKLWEKPELTCYFATPVALGKQLYMVTGQPSIFSKATLHCVDLETGKTLWSHGGVGTYHASLIRTGNGKLLLLEEKGDLVLLDPNPDKYQDLARSRVCGNTWAHPALADGKLFVRDREHLICVDLRP